MEEIAVPPMVIFLAIPTPPDTTKAPVELDVDTVVLLSVTTPEAPIVVAPEIAPERAKLVKVPTEVILP